MDSENRTALSGDEADEADKEEDEKWRIERLEREKWMQGNIIGIICYQKFIKDELLQNLVFNLRSPHERQKNTALILFLIPESESKEGEKVHDVCANPNESQFFSVASKVMKKLDSKPKSGEANKSTSFPTATTSKVFKSPKAKLPLQLVVSLKFILLYLSIIFILLFSVLMDSSIRPKKLCSF